MNLHDWVLFLITLNVIVGVFAFAGWTDTNPFVADTQLTDADEYQDAYQTEIETGDELQGEEDGYGSSVTSSKGILSKLDQAVFGLPALLDQAFAPREVDGTRTATGYLTLTMRGIFTFMYAFFFAELIRGVILS